MPFIGGYGYIPVIAVTPSGSFIFDSTPGSEAYAATGGFGVLGGLIYQFDPEGVFQLFNSDGDVPMGFVEISNLPVDFIITSINPSTFVTVSIPAGGLPTPGGLYEVSGGGGTSWTAPNLTSSLPTWDGTVAGWAEAMTEELYDPFTLSFDVDNIDADINTIGMAAEIDAVDLQINGRPTNVLQFNFVGTFETGTPPTSPTNPNFQPVNLSKCGHCG